MDAYQGTEDATLKNAIVMAAFGKSGAALIPILETDTAELKRLEKAVSVTITDDDIARVREMKIREKELGSQWEQLTATIGQKLFPVKEALINKLAEEVFIQQHLGEELAKNQYQTMSNVDAYEAATKALRAQFQASLSAKVELDELTDVQRAAADAAQRNADAERTLYDAIHKSTDASFAYRQSLLDLKKAQKDAHDAKGKDAEANLRLEQAYHRVADAAVDLANDQRASNGQAALSTDEAVTIEIAALERLMKGMDKNSPLYKNLAAYVALLQKQVDLQRAAASTALSQTPSSILSRSRGGHGQLMDDGGTVAGPPGSLQPVLARGGEQFSGYPPKPMGGGGGGPTIVVNIHGGVFADHGPTLDKLAQAILQRARYAPGR